MEHDPVRTRVRTDGAWHDFQAFMIRQGGSAPDFDAVEGVELTGVEASRVTPEVQAASVLGQWPPAGTVAPKTTSFFLHVSAKAEYLRRVRAVVTDPERVVVCSGIHQGLVLLARAELAPEAGA